MMMNWKGFGRKRSLSNLKVLSRHLLGRTEESHKNLSQDTLRGQDLNPAPPGHETKVKLKVYYSFDRTAT
jgi:hypothetical protein